MKVTRPIKTINFTHKETGEILELKTGDKVIINTEHESNLGIIHKITHYNGHILIILQGDEGNIQLGDDHDNYYSLFYMEDIETIGKVKPQDYNIFVDTSIRDYELEISPDKPIIMLNKGDIVEVAFMDEQSDIYYTQGILDNATDRRLCIKTFSSPISTYGFTTIPAEKLITVKILARVEDNLTNSLVTEY